MPQSVWARNVIAQQMIKLEWPKKCVERTKMLDCYVRFYLHVVLPDVTTSREHLSSLPGVVDDLDHIHAVLQNACAAEL